MIPGSNQSPSDPDVMEMVLNLAGDRFVEQYKPLEEVRGVYLNRFEGRGNFEVEYHYPRLPSDKVYRAFLDGTKSFDDVISEIGLDAKTERTKVIADAYRSVLKLDKREALQAKIDKTKNSIAAASSVSDILDIYDNFNLDVGDDEEVCEECQSFRRQFLAEVEDNFVGSSAAIFNRMWFDIGRECGRDEFDRVVRIFDMDKATSAAAFDGTLGNSLQFARQDFPVRIGANVNDKTALDVVAHSVHAFWMPVDRSGTLDTPGLKLTAEAIPDASGFTKTLEDVMLEEAKRIWDLNREFRVYWSGGIDSTGVLTALLQTVQPGDLDRMTVVYTANDASRSSTTEYPEFFRDYIDGKLKTFCVNSGPGGHFLGSPVNMLASKVGGDLAENAEKGVLCVTGELGDQAFGSAAFSNNADLINMTADDYLKGDEFQPFIEDIKRLNSASPIDTDKLVDLLWWWNFAVKWQEVRWRATVCLEDGSKLANVHAFFGGEDFQRWSIANPDKKIKDTPASYKFSLKDFIFDYTKDADYRDTKLKEGSLRVRVGSIAGIDDKNNIIKWGETSTNDALMQQRYGDSLKRFLK